MKQPPIQNLWVACTPCPSSTKYFPNNKVAIPSVFSLSRLFYKKNHLLFGIQTRSLFLVEIWENISSLERGIAFLCIQPAVQTTSRQHTRAQLVRCVLVGHRRQRPIFTVVGLLLRPSPTRGQYSSFTRVSDLDRSRGSSGAGAAGEEARVAAMCGGARRWGGPCGWF